MERSISLVLLLGTILCRMTFAQGYLTPLDFGLHPTDHGRIDYQHTPPHILCGDFNYDCYPDIARFVGNRLEIYLFLGKGYSPKPQGIKSYCQPIASLALGGDPWLHYYNLVVTLQDGTADTINQHGGWLDLQENAGFLPTKLTYLTRPRVVDDFTFQQVWESQVVPCGMYTCTVGDLDNDGVNELVTWRKDSLEADTAYVLIYKSTGDDRYELFMEEPFTVTAPYTSGCGFMLMADLDQNGQKEIIFAAENRFFFWEFSAPGVYTKWRSGTTFSPPVAEAKVTDVDQDGILELTVLCNSWSLTPPTSYEVHEFFCKSTWPQLYFNFTGIFARSQEWMDCHIDVGDFDNDGVVDIVSGNAGFVWSYNPVNIQYFRYDSTVFNNFTQEWLQTGIPLSCVDPVIADYDLDGLNELFCPGLGPFCGAAFFWEGTGQGVGSVAWLDTTDMLGPNESEVGIIDGSPRALNFTEYYYQSYLNMFGCQSGQYGVLWQDGPIDSGRYLSLHFLDMDQDGKMNFIGTVNDNYCDTAFWTIDWEQTAAQVNTFYPNSLTLKFQLYQNYPNPFNATTEIPFTLLQLTNIELSIYDIKGSIVYHLKENNVSPGDHQVKWRAENLSSGLYFISLKTPTEIQIRKALLLK